MQKVTVITDNLIQNINKIITLAFVSKTKVVGVLSWEKHIVHLLSRGYII